MARRFALVTPASGDDEPARPRYGVRMRIAFMGTPDFAVPTLNRLAADGHELVAVYTQPPRRAGRGKAFTPSPVHRRAESLGLTVRTPVSLRDADAQDEWRNLRIDVGVVAAYGLILPQAILDAPRLGCLNVHGSLLPRWRGAAPVQRAILAGDAETGVTIMGMDLGLDTGPMHLMRTTPVADKTAGELTMELAAIGAAAMSEVLPDLDHYPPVPQPEDGVTYAAKIEKHEARLNFAQPAVDVIRQIRAFAPIPGAFFEHAGERIRVLAAEHVDLKTSSGIVIDNVLTIACNDAAVRPTRVGRAGRGIMTTDELLRGFPIPAGTRLA